MDVLAAYIWIKYCSTTIAEKQVGSSDLKWVALYENTDDDIVSSHMKVWGVHKRTEWE